MSQSYFKISFLCSIIICLCTEGITAENDYTKIKTSSWNYKYLGYSEKVELKTLPNTIQQKINTITENEFKSLKVYDETLDISSVPKEITRISAPNNFYLFSYYIKPYSYFFNLYVFLYDPKTQNITNDPVPFDSRDDVSISFIDIDQDSIPEISYTEYWHCGTQCDGDTTHYYKINADLSLSQIFYFNKRSESICNGVDCTKNGEFTLLPNKNIKIIFSATLPDEVKKQIGEIIFHRVDDKSPFIVESYKVYDPEYKDDIEFEASRPRK
jgi:hypothetical protein